MLLIERGEEQVTRIGLSVGKSHRLNPSSNAPVSDELFWRIDYQIRHSITLTRWPSG